MNPTEPLPESPDSPAPPRRRACMFGVCAVALLGQGGWDERELTDLILLLKSGELPSRLELLREERVDK